jgi:uncharacterized protein YbjQ (UPF0145 family)
MRITMTCLGLLSMVTAGCADTLAQSGEHGAHHESASGGDHDDDHDDDDAPVNVSPEQIAHVQVFESGNVPQATEVLGTVDVHMGVESEQQAMQRLRARAASLGADALLGVEFHHGEANGPTHLSGLAVRYHDLLQGRSYDVVGALEVQSEMGHDHDALGRLRAEARDRHADLILNIHFEHGDDPHGHPMLRGDAIRFR